MQLFKKEVRTGLLVIITLTILVAVLIVLGAPGVFTPMNHYYIFFDNAGGVKQGAPVLLAGRKVGSVTTLISPVPLSDRPARFKQDEILVGVEVLKSAADLSRGQRPDAGEQPAGRRGHRLYIGGGKQWAGPERRDIRWGTREGFHVLHRGRGAGIENGDHARWRWKPPRR